MPLDKHYGGHGEKVAEEMKEEYGDRWEEVFYATENARKKKKYDDMLKKKGKA